MMLSAFDLLLTISDPETTASTLTCKYCISFEVGLHAFAWILFYLDNKMFFKNTSCTWTQHRVLEIHVKTFFFFFYLNLPREVCTVETIMHIACSSKRKYCTISPRKQKILKRWIFNPKNLWLFFSFTVVLRADHQIHEL